MNVFKKNLCSWYNDVMDPASGWYKRNTQRILMAIAVVLCLFNNVDTVSLVGHLSTDPQMRAAAVTEAVGFLEHDRTNAQDVGPRIERAAEFDGGPEATHTCTSWPLTPRHCPSGGRSPSGTNFSIPLKISKRTHMVGTQSSDQAMRPRVIRRRLSLDSGPTIRGCSRSSRAFSFRSWRSRWALRSGSTFSTSWLTSAWSGTVPTTAAPLHHLRQPRGRLKAPSAHAMT